MLEANAAMEAPVRAHLARLIADRPAHARFMNMLSMLEHMGSRKIMVSQMHRSETLSEDTLKHLAEEARHAYFFKRQAERAAGHALDGWLDSNTTARVPALMYFGRMDAGISQEVGDEAAYYWVSLVIELRACWLYRIYQAALEESDYQLSLKSLIAEEDGHLEEMFGACGANVDLLKRLSAYETGLFNKLWVQIDNSVEIARAA
jgi:hypothetical protein